MRRVVIQCQHDDDIPIIMEIINSYGGSLIRPQSPQRFDMIHVDLSEENETTLSDFVKELQNELISIKCEKHVQIACDESNRFPTFNQIEHLLKACKTKMFRLCSYRIN
ncbi:unnamed protein product [Schistosoma mattheei]|uniref:Uncharacterized protein n=1 Tax=Schistosoma mattheei TaxID=31246 RepID=A0AA85C3I4_9TREM|nr:unnamed protein product [Schistosoma mattheei]CAH8621054.1 unnamed protein product [Schistosoma haematobium]